MRTRTLIALLAALVLAATAATFVVAWRIRARSPRTSAPSIVVFFASGDATSNEKNVLDVLEPALGRVPRVAHTEGRATSSGTTLLVTLAPGADPSQALAGVNAAIREKLVALPHGVPPASVSIFSRADGPRFAVRGNATQTPADVRAVLDETIAPRLESAAGVGTVSTCGGLEPAIEVVVDGGRLAGFDLNGADVTDALRGSLASAHGLDDLGAIDVRGGTRVRDLATVRETGRPPSCVAYDADGPLVLGSVDWQPGAKGNPAVISTALASAASSLPPGSRVVPIDLDGAVRLHAFVELEHPPDYVALTRVAAELARTLRVPDARQIVVASPRVPRPGVDLEVEAVLPPASSVARVDAARRALAGALAKFPGIASVTRTDDEPLTVLRVVGADLDADRRAAADVQAALGAVDGVLGALVVGARMEVSRDVDVDAATAARQGLTPTEITAELARYTTGETVGTLHEGARARPVWVRVGGSPARARVHHDGALVPVLPLVEATARLVPEEIEHRDGQRAVTIWLGLASPIGVRAAKAAVAAVKLPAGVAVVWGE